MMPAGCFTEQTFSTAAAQMMMSLITVQGTSSACLLSSAGVLAVCSEPFHDLQIQFVIFKCFQGT